MAVKVWTVGEFKQELLDFAKRDGQIGFLGDDASWVNSVLALGERAHGRGDGVAIYVNQDLGHPDIGQWQVVSYGGSEAQLETHDRTYPDGVQTFTHGDDVLTLVLPDIGGRINYRYWLEAIVPSYAQQEAVADQVVPGARSCVRCNASLVATENGWADDDGQQGNDDHNHYVDEDIAKDKQALARDLGGQSYIVTVRVHVSVGAADEYAATKLVAAAVDNGIDVWHTSAGECGYADGDTDGVSAYDDGVRLSLLTFTAEEDQ